MLWGGRNTANKYHWCLWGVFAVFQPHWVCLPRPTPAPGMCAFPVYAAQALGCSAGNCLMRALGCVHFPGLSRSGSGTRVLHKGTDLVGPAFCALPRSEKLGQPGTYEHTLPRWEVCLITSPIPAAQFPGCTVGVPSQVCCVSPLGS